MVQFAELVCYMHWNSEVTPGIELWLHLLALYTSDMLILYDDAEEVFTG